MCAYYNILIFTLSDIENDGGAGVRKWQPKPVKKKSVLQTASHGTLHKLLRSSARIGEQR